MRVVTELRGEPLAFGGPFSYTRRDGSEMVIEKAVDITEECVKVAQGFKVYIFYSTGKDGVDGYIVYMTPAREPESFEGFCLAQLDSIQRRAKDGTARYYGIMPNLFFKILKEQAPSWQT